MRYSANKLTQLATFGHLKIDPIAKVVNFHTLLAHAWALDSQQAFNPAGWPDSCGSTDPQVHAKVVVTLATTNAQL